MNRLYVTIEKSQPRVVRFGILLHKTPYSFCTPCSAACG